MDLRGSIRVKTLSGNKYVFVIVDDRFIFTWLFFLKDKTNAFEVFAKHCRQLKNIQGLPVMAARSDLGIEFKRTIYSIF